MKTILINFIRRARMELNFHSDLRWELCGKFKMTNLINASFYLWYRRQRMGIFGQQKHGL